MPTDIYCGVVSADSWPFREPLVVELEVERGSYLIADIHISANLQGLLRHLRRRFCGVPITRLETVTQEDPEGIYHADYWKWVIQALFWALKAFEEDRISEYRASSRRVYWDDQGIVLLQDKRGGLGGLTSPA